MAAALYNKATASNNAKSAGTAVFGSLAPSCGAIRAMASRGIDISDHRSHQVTAEDIAWADLVLTMTGAHRDALCASFGEDKIHTLAACAGEEEDVSDPFGGSDDIYEACAAQLEKYIQKLC